MNWKKILSLALVAMVATMGVADQMKPPKASEAPYYPPKGTHPSLVSGNLVKPIMLPAPKDNTYNWPSVEREPNEGTGIIKTPFLGEPIVPNPATSGNEVGIAANSLITSFNGIPATTLTPPDNSVAVGINHIVQTVNSTVRITDKIGNVLYNNTIQSFLNRPTAFIFDPKVIYDPWRNRWVMMWHEQSSTTSYLHIVVSADSNPFTNGWWYYAFDARWDSNTSWADNYDLGYGQNAVYACGNQFTFSSSSFTTATFRTWDPNQIYNAQAAGMITDYNLFNADGTQTFAPRAVHMMWSGDGGNWFVNSRRLGASKLTFWKTLNPLGAHTTSRFDINVAAYTPPPDAKDPASHNIDTGDARMSPATYSFDPVSGKLRVFTSLNCTSTPEPTNAACRLYILDPNSATPELDLLLWVSGTSSYYAAPGVNYDTCCNWVFTTSSTSSFPSARFVNWEPTTGFSFSYNTLWSGSNNYAGGRWGDYFQGDCDWGDASYSPKQKIWMYGEFANPSANWGTAVGATGTVGNAFGNMNVSSGGLSWSGYAGNVTGSGGTYTVSNTGTMSDVWTISNIASYLSASVNQAETWGNSTTNTTVTANSGINSLGYGHYVSNLTFHDEFNGGNVNRTMDVQVYGRCWPTSLTVKLGKLVSGKVGDLDTIDGVNVKMCKFLVPNLTTPPIQVEVDATGPSGPVGVMYFWVYAKMTSAGSYKMKTEVWNWNTNGWDTTNFNDQTITTSYDLFTIVTTGDGNRFKNGSNAVRGKYSIRATGFVATIAWCEETDLVQWAFVAP